MTDVRDRKRDEIEHVIAAIRERAKGYRETEVWACQSDASWHADEYEEWADRLEAVLLQQRLVETEGWMPIDGAPKDGTRVLLCWGDGIAAPMFDVGYNLGDGRRWQDTHQWLHNDHSWPTHWMPLPQPPKDSGEIPEPDSHTNEGHKTKGM